MYRRGVICDLPLRYYKEFVIPKTNKILMNIAHRITGEVWFVIDAVVDWVDIFTRPKYKLIIESLRYCLE